LTGARQVEREAMRAAAAALHLDPRNARLVSSSSRMMWHLPGAGAALAISRAGNKSLADVMAEASAVAAAGEAGVRTPALLAAPLEIDGPRHVLAFRWLDGRPLGPHEWRSAAVEAAKLAVANPSAFRPLAWPAAWPRPQWLTILGDELFEKLAGCCYAASIAFSKLQGNLVPAHCDLQPANYLIDGQGRAWLIDFEYASLAPPGWDPAKLVILSRRFHDPAGCDDLLSVWPDSTTVNIDAIAEVQEVLLVAWLANMTLNDAPAAELETRARVASLGTPDRWRHLR
jgi:Ser/Thr protein kinase RdoA (MazF antagonist)